MPTNGATAALLEEIRGRGKASIEQALAMLDLYAISETEAKHQLIQTASRGLPAREVVARFIQVAAEEKDTGLREHLVAELFWIDVREISDVPAWVALLAACLEEERVRARAAACLARIVANHPAAQDALVAACRKSHTRSHERQLLSALCTLENPPPAVRALFIEMLGRVDADVKGMLLSRLLTGNGLAWEVLEKLLAPTEPLWVKRMAIEELLERPLEKGSGEEAEADAALIGMLARDPEPECRAAAVQALATRAGRSSAIPRALLTALQKDPHANVRAAAMLAFDHSLAQSDEALIALAAALSTERTREGMALLLRLVSPLAGRSPAVREALVQLTHQDLRAELAELVIEVLGKLAAGDAQLASTLLASLETERDERVRAALLEAVLRDPDLEGAHLDAYLAALKSSSPRLRALGVTGLLRVPLQPVNLLALAPAVEALKDPKIDRWARVPLANKLARLTQADPQRALAPLFKTIAAQVDDRDVRAICEDAADKAAAAAAAQDGSKIDWSDWFQRVEVEHRTEGIFPDLFVHFDDNPDFARRILRAAINPPAVDTLYATYRGQLSANTIVGWLRDRGLVDDDISRYCLTRLLGPENGEGDHFYLGVLKSNPAYPPLREDVWRLLEKRKAPPPVLMRELMLAAYGGAEETISAELNTRLAAQKTPSAAQLYLRFLLGNAPWRPAQLAFLSLKAGSPAMADAESMKLIEQIEKAMSLKLPVPAVSKMETKPGASANQDGPGLADD